MSLVFVCGVAPSVQSVCGHICDMDYGRCISQLGGVYVCRYIVQYGFTIYDVVDGVERRILFKKTRILAIIPARAPAGAVAVEPPGHGPRLTNARPCSVHTGPYFKS